MIDKTAAYNSFWLWFQNNSVQFNKILNGEGDIEKDLFNKLTDQLSQIRDGYWFYLDISSNGDTELVFTADSVVENIVFIEELVDAAPEVDGWNFIALKPASSVDDDIELNGLIFNKDNIMFYLDQDSKYPDQLNLIISYSDLNDKNRTNAINGVQLFLDNILGELDFATLVDSISIITEDQADKKLISISKLKEVVDSYKLDLLDRSKDLRYSNSKEDDNSCLEGTLQNDMPIIAAINSSRLRWDHQGSHPWVLVLTSTYTGGESGMPFQETYDLMDSIENEIISKLTVNDGYLLIGRETANGSRDTYFTAVEFRKLSKVLHSVVDTYKDRLDMRFNIYKDIHWKSFRRFGIE